jgi:hypothetical protein
MLIEDGQPYRYCGLAFISIGWLEPESSYRTGITQKNVTDRLAEMLRKSTWQPFCSLAYHHCDLEWCGTRLKARSFLELIRVPICWAGMLSERIKREVESVSERDALIRRTLYRHQRRHHLPDVASQSRNPGAEGVLLRMKLLSAQALRLFTNMAERSIGAAMNILEPHPYKESWGNVQIKLGASNLFIPGSDQVYIAPSLLLHYIVRHGYLPPDEFCESVLRCPPVDTRTYFEAFRPALPESASRKLAIWVDQQLRLTQELRVTREIAEN